jgi:RNA polymerase sigma factor (sigma-70 family)
MPPDLGLPNDDTHPLSNEVLGHQSQMLRGALTRYFARNGVDRSEIDDLIQDVFLRILKRGGTDGLENFGGYVFETAASVIKDRVRRRASRHADRHEAFDPDLHGGAALDAEHVLAGRQALRKTTTALMELPERTRQVFVLRRLEELSYKEISRRLGLPVSTLEKHMLRAVRHLLARVGDAR